MTGILGGIAGALGGILGEGSVARQFFVWGLLSNIVTEATGPFQVAIRNKVNADNPLIPLSPAELADMTVRGIVGQDFGATEAAKNGLSAGNFDLLVKSTGEPPALQELLQLFRRGRIDQPTLERAIKESRVKDEWIPYVLEMGLDEPTPIDILTAYLKGQVDQGTAEDLYKKLGGDPDYFQLLYDTRGEGPTPNEAAAMARRGVIPWTGLGADVTSYEQAVHEGAFRNKWADAFRALAAYIPPPRTVSTLYAEHAITQEQANELYQKAGLSPDLAAAFLAGATKTKTVTHRNLAVGTIGALYEDRAITPAQAESLLTLMGYDASEAQFILLVHDMRRQEKFMNTAISAVHAQYVSHKIGRDVASTTLDKLGIDATHRDSLLALWDLERGARVAVLTPAQIKKAANDDIITQDEAHARLVDRGYSDGDATIFLSI